MNKNDKDEYLLRCLGRNGEPLSNVYLDFKFYHKYSTNTINVKLVSN